MNIGVPREIHRHEHRVGLTPFAVARLAREGHTIIVEKGAGLTARFTDQDFVNAGAQVVYSADEVYKRCELVCRVSVLSPEEIDFLAPGATIAGFQHLAVVPKPTVERLMELETTLVGYEIIRDRSGDLPVLRPFSVMAGQMAVHIGAQCSNIEEGGRGILLGTVPGVPPPTVLILGAGAVGRTAARLALSSGAHVIVIDEDYAKLEIVNHESQGQVVTVVAGFERLERYTAIADVVIGAVLIPGGRPPLLVTEKMVQAMKPGSVVIDISIDQGGCIETSRPTTIDNPTFVKHGVVHYCVPNMTANIARTASRALAGAAIPYLLRIAANGIDFALREDPGLAAGVFLYRGKLVNRTVGETLGIEVTPLHSLLEEGPGA